MPIRHTDKGWYWGSKGPFPTKAKAMQVGRAAYASGYKEQVMNKTAIGEFVGVLLHSATITHIMHFQAQGEGSYATHKALGAYYEGIQDLTDTLVEIIQGCYGEIISDYPSMYSLTTDTPLDYMATLKDYVAEKRVEMPQESNIQNEIDNVANLIDTTLYKLKFLR